MERQEATETLAVYSPTTNLCLDTSVEGVVDLHLRLPRPAQPIVVFLIGKDVRQLPFLRACSTLAWLGHPYQHHVLFVVGHIVAFEPTPPLE